MPQFPRRRKQDREAVDTECKISLFTILLNMVPLNIFPVVRMIVGTIS